MSTEVKIPLTNRLAGRSTEVRFFSDDTIEVVRIKIGLELGIHHDRLRMYVTTELPGSYYDEDPRAWKSLFLRMSPDGKPLRDISKASYQASRDLPFPFPDGEIDEARWSTDVPRKFESSFQELRLLGVPEAQSWIFPLDNMTDPMVLPETAEIARPANRLLFKSVHPGSIKGIVVVPYEEGGRPLLKDQYVPYLRPGTPAAVPDSLRNTVTQQTELLDTLATLKIKNPTQTTVLRGRWKIPMVETNFGEAPRNRFEQMFFGLTLSKSTPYVGFYTSKTEQTRHKFYTEDTVNKKPTLDLREWAHWWTVSKPSRNRPTFIVYRGDGRSHFDRIAISETDIIISSQRPEGNKESIADMQASVLKWLGTLDSVTPFLEPADLNRIELQTSSVELTYAEPLEVADFLRFDCLRTIYDIYDKKTLSFRFLRADGSDLGLTPQESSVISMIREDSGTSPDDIADTLNIPLPEAERLLMSVRSKLDDDESLFTKVSSALPSFRFSAKGAIAVSVDDVPRMESYISILRHILMTPNETALDTVCPKRGEEAEAVAGVAEVFAPPPVAPAEEGDLGDLLGDLLADIGGDDELNVAAVAPLSAPVPVEKSKKEKAKVKTTSEEETLYSYFSNRLKEFDPETFSSGKTGCDLVRQPVVMSQEELDREGPQSEYNPYNQEYEDTKLMTTEDPNGVFLCPEYWCVIDKIPLREIDLKNGTCPVCGGKVRDPKSKAKISEYPLVKRSEKYQFPGELKTKAPNGKPIPCCFQKPQKTRVSKMIPLPPSRIELFYILGESKMDLPAMRFAYLQPKTIAALQLNTSYDAIKRDQNRIQAGRSGIFRVGIGIPRETLPSTLGGKALTIPSPGMNPDDVLRCSFFRSWNRLASNPSPALANKFAGNEVLARMVQGIQDAWESGELSVLNELEYCCIALDCDMYRVVVETDGSASVGCQFASGFLRGMNRAIAVTFQKENPATIDYIGFVSRTSSSTEPQVITNLFNPVFSKDVRTTLNDARDKACWTAPLPSLSTVLQYTRSSSVKSYLILDPYKRVQALFYPKRAILPFQPESLVEIQNFQVLDGYSSIAETDLPPKSNMLQILAGISKYHRGYEYREDLADQTGTVREIVLASGLRIPVAPFKEAPPARSLEVTETVRKGNERILAFGKPNKEDTKNAAKLRYENEVFDFLLYQLSKDIEDDPELKEAVISKDRQRLAPALSDWLDGAVVFHQLQDPPAFVSKIRTPCTKRPEKDCTGVCAWVGSACKVDVKTFKRDTIESRLLSTLLSNDKIRSIVVESRVSPFFSTVLYLEMPHELFMSDTDLDEYKKVARSE
jgi:hypothetical protein